MYTGYIHGHIKWNHTNALLGNLRLYVKYLALIFSHKFSVASLDKLPVSKFTPFAIFTEINFPSNDEKIKSPFFHILKKEFSSKWMRLIFLSDDISSECQRVHAFCIACTSFIWKHILGLKELFFLVGVCNYLELSVIISGSTKSCVKIPKTNRFSQLDTRPRPVHLP